MIILLLLVIVAILLLGGETVWDLIAGLFTLAFWCFLLAAGLAIIGLAVGSVL
jgi:hypothetical protein